MADFFDYYCDNCDKPFCERIQVMNLALNYVEEAFCLECLASREGVEPEAFYYWILDYVASRDCFKTPWENFSAASCPRIVDKTCFCKVA